MNKWSLRKATRTVAFLALLSAVSCTSDEQRALDHLEQGQGHLLAGQRTEAALEYQSALRFDPRSIEAHNRLAEIALMSGDFVAALSHIQEAYRLDPTDAHAALHLASLLRADQPERADALVEAVIEREPDNPAGYIGRSDQALSQGRTRDAVEAARKAMEVAPDDPTADWQYGHVLQAMIREGQITGEVAEASVYSEAIKAFERYITWGGPSPWNARIEQARVMAAWPGKGREAAAQYRIAVEHAFEAGPVEDRHRAAVRAADFARSSGDSDLFEWSLEQVVAAEPRDHRSWRDLAELYRKRGKDPEEVWQRFLEKVPNEPRPHIEYARHLVFSWKLDEALAYLSERAEEGIDPAMLLGAIASTQIAAGRLPDAETTVRRLERDHPDHPRAILERAQLDMRKGRVAKARRSLRKLVERSPDYNAYLLLARVEEASGKPDAALDAIERAIASSTAFNYEAKRMQARLLASRGSCEDSLRNLVEIRDRMQLSPTDQVLLARCRYETGQEIFGRRILRDLVASRRPPPEAVIEFARREGTDPESANLARRELEALLRRKPKHWEAILELTRLDVAADRKSTALERLDQLVESEPDAVPAPIRLLRAQVSAAAGREAGTLEDAMLAFESQPRLRGSLEMVVALHLRRSQIDEAIAAAEQAREAGALNAPRKLLLGQLYRMKGREAEALAAFEQAIESRPEDPTLYYHMGLALRSLDRDPEASQAFERALAISSSFPEADEARRALEGT